MIEQVTKNCPYCDEPIDLVVDLSAGNSRYVEDCEVCCQPIIIDIQVSHDGKLDSLYLQPENV